ncbi:hypothetical protein [Kitasatospora sp. DSM 101779]|uniref:hypothetical protein n=1 Tax=Kitasatospora sp. DSM 101779 TaxID=2853165 RepID=UPI0021D87CD9|nr:hypothetical protein [Kitasatospora sp. DSM 101779]MCU7826133.1 hypothetical protein [Kitasatospora sp. DSM 101779]
MTCADYRAATSAQLDGEAPADDRAVHCADCAEWLAAARRLQALTRAADGPSPEWTERLLGSLGLGPATAGEAESTDETSHGGS